MQRFFTSSCSQDERCVTTSATRLVGIQHGGSDKLGGYERARFAQKQRLHKVHQRRTEGGLFLQHLDFTAADAAEELRSRRQQNANSAAAAEATLQARREAWTLNRWYNQPLVKIKYFVPSHELHKYTGDDPVLFFNTTCIMCRIDFYALLIKNAVQRKVNLHRDK